MAQGEPTAEFHAGFSESDASAPSWAEVVAVLTAAEMFWLSTVRRDGRPHVTPLPAIWLDGALHFCTGADEQKSKNLESNPSCVLTTGTNTLHSGLDVIAEGTARRVTTTDHLGNLAALWKSKLDWSFEVGDGVFHDPEGRVGLVFGLEPAKVLCFGKDPYSQTRFRFTG